jgi:enoyl-CoA hydratase/carnithine racemase
MFTIARRLSNPPVNALGRKACYLLTEAVKRAQSDSSEAIIIAPAADVPFSAGADIKEFGGDQQDGYVS